MGCGLSYEGTDVTRQRVTGNRGYARRLAQDSGSNPKEDEAKCEEEVKAVVSK